MVLPDLRGGFFYIGGEDVAILRKNNKEQYTTIPQGILRDERLSLKDIGLLVCMLSLPDNWKFSENGLEAIFKNDGQASIRTGLKKLEEAGYLHRERERGADGKIGSVTWYLYDEPLLHPECYNPRLENPSVDNPSLENPPQSNTKESNTKESNTKEYIDGFDKFWSLYPKKKAKEAARKAWAKLKLTNALATMILADVEAKKRTQDWKKENGKYIPYPATYLNGKRWEDEGGSFKYDDTHNSDEDLGDLMYGR
jgi:hypothetical protein